MSRHPSRLGPNEATGRPQDPEIASDQQSMRQGDTATTTLAPVPHRPSDPGTASDTDRSVGTDESVSAHDDFPPTGNDATPRSRGDPLQTPAVSTAGQGLAADEISQLRQENAHLRQRLDEEIAGRHRAINDLEARAETEARKFSERLAKLEAELWSR
jgi:hypothetical protein